MCLYILRVCAVCGVVDGVRTLPCPDVEGEDEVHAGTQLNTFCLAFLCDECEEAHLPGLLGLLEAEMVIAAIIELGIMPPE
jgi:hypothetical protein